MSYSVHFNYTYVVPRAVIVQTINSSNEHSSNGIASDSMMVKIKIEIECRHHCIKIWQRLKNFKNNCILILHISKLYTADIAGGSLGPQTSPPELLDGGGPKEILKSWYEIKVSRNDTTKIVLNKWPELKYLFYCFLNSHIFIFIVLIYMHLTMHHHKRIVKNTPNSTIINVYLTLKKIKLFKIKNVQDGLNDYLFFWIFSFLSF